MASDLQPVLGGPLAIGVIDDARREPENAALD
jgi:hypothetical protein